MTNLECEFHQAMLDTHQQATKLGYHAHFFLNMVIDSGGVGAAKRLLSTTDEQAGLTSLWDLGRLDLSVEAHVVKEPWSSLFTEDERQVARKRLQDYKYDRL